MGKKAKKRVIKNKSAVTVTNISSLNTGMRMYIFSEKKHLQTNLPKKRPAMEQKQIQLQWIFKRRVRLPYLVLGVGASEPWKETKKPNDINCEP